MSRSLGIPVKLLHEATGHIVTVELKSGELYRGSMVECEDNWNCQLENITYTAKVPFSVTFIRWVLKVPDFSFRWFSCSPCLEVCIFEFNFDSSFKWVLGNLGPESVYRYFEMYVYPMFKTKLFHLCHVK